MKSISEPLHSDSGTRVALALLTCSIALSMAVPAHAGIIIPNKPVDLGSAVPPNVTLILDTSGSMSYRSLPEYDVSLSGGGLPNTDDGDSVPLGGPDGTRELSNSTNVFDFDSDNLPDVAFRTYTYNTLSYNPNVAYTPWVKADNTLMTSTPYTAVYVDGQLASGTTTSLAGYTPFFLAPKAGITDLNDLTQYYRYQIRTDGKVVRSERDSVNTTTTQLFSRNGLGATRDNWVGGNTGVTAPATIASGLSATIVIPVNTLTLVVRTVGNDPDADLYVRSGALPTTTLYDCRQTSQTSNETCTINNPAAGNWYIGVRADNNASGEATNSNGNNNTFANLTLSAEITTGDPETGVASVGCDTTLTGWGWRHCAYATPTGRSEADERANYAIWWSYYRTRNKTAKAGVTRAFSELGGEYRVGLAGLGSIVQRIPVGSDGGLFRDRASPASTNRSTWFANLIAMDASGSTPLRTALKRVGDYYSESAAADNPYKGTGVVELACRQNFAILTTDGYWNGGAVSGLNGDEDAGPTITGPNAASYTYAAVAPYRGPTENTLADVAMHYWKRDLRTDAAMTNIVPTTTADPAFWQHMSTFGISLGLRGQLQTSDFPALQSGTLAWPVPSDGGDAENIDDLWHAAVNGRGKFVAATSPQLFASALRSALAAVVERTASNSNVAANSSTLSTETRLFQARYVSNRWIGELVAFPVTTGTLGTVPAWSASQEIPAPNSRTILTWDGSGGADFPTAAQSATLNTPIAGITDFLRGDQSQELSQGNGGSFRDRVHVLGDVINSSPFFVKETNTVYIGANDGLLHAINAADGTEVFAYMPGNIDLTALKSLAAENYSHSYFVDGPLVVSTRNQSAANKNFLVGSLGRGGKGVFGLDVTDPANFDSSNVLWDFDATNHDLMGQVLARPFIAKLNNGQLGVIVSNGPNSTGDKAVLYVLNVATGAVIAEIDTGVGGALAPNGLSTPRGWDNDGDGDLDLVYAGDLRGNFWKFDLSSASPSNWSLAANRFVLFQAKDAANNFQPISGSPSIGVDPISFKRWVFFGTGRMLNSDDVTNADGTPNLSVQTWYGLIDQTTPITGRTELMQRSIIAAGSIAGTPVRGFEAVSDLAAGKKGWYIDLKTPPGTAEGERMIGDSALIGTTLLGASVIPSSSACGSGGGGFINALNAFTGASVSSNFFDVDGDGEFDDDTVTGGGSTVPVGSLNLGAGMPTNPIIISGGGGGGPGGPSGGVATICHGTSAADADCGRVREAANKGRISWREVIED